MSVRLISYSKHVAESGISGGLQDIVAFCARVSNPANQANTDTNERLIRYLIKNEHWSPLEMVSVCLEIETTRDIARQILRHRSFSFQEFSQRYAVTDLGFEFREARLQDTKNRQTALLSMMPDYKRLGKLSKIVSQKPLKLHTSGHWIMELRKNRRVQFYPRE